MIFKDRRDAGRKLGERLASMAITDALVLGLPRGGIPVAFEVARALDAPLDVLIVRKLGVPYQPELGFGAIAEGGVTVINEPLMERAGITEAQFESVVADETEELERRVARYRGDRPLERVRGKTAVLVDDGLATGYTARAGLAALKELGAKRVILAVPGGSPESVKAIGREVDDVVCLDAPAQMMAVGQFYQDFRQTTDQEVTDLLSEANPDRSAPGGGPGQSSGPIEREVVIEAGSGVTLAGNLTLPASPVGIVVFVHGSGSSRNSPRNVAVARSLNEVGLGTLLFDLLTDSEAADRQNVFDISLLATRLRAATDWLDSDPALAGLPTGFFGASTGAAAALVAAADLGKKVSAVVSRGGRPDLAGAALGRVVAPTLLVVGGADLQVLELNREAEALMTCPRELVVIPGATHLFEEAGTLEEVARLAGLFFTRCLSSAAGVALAAEA